MDPLVQWLDRIVPYVLGPMRTVPRDPLALGPLRARRCALGAARRQAVHDRCGTGTGRRRRRTLHAAPDGALDRRLRPVAGRAGPRRRVARRRRWERGHHYRHWPPSCAASAAWSTPGSSIESLDELPPARAVLLDTSPRQFVALAGPRLSRRAARPWARFRAGPGYLQGRLGARRPGALGGRAVSSNGHGARGRHLRRGGPGGGRGAGRSSRRAPVRAGGPALGRRPDPGPRRAAHAVGLLPRAQRIGRGHERADGGSRSSASRPGSATVVLARSVRTAAQAEAYDPNLLGGDINGGAATLRQTVFRPVASLESLPDAARGGVSLFGVDATRRRGARDVRCVGGPQRPARTVSADLDRPDVGAAVRIAGELRRRSVPRR